MANLAAGTQAGSSLSFLNSSLGALPTLETPFLSFPFGRQECLPYNRISLPLRIAISATLEILHGLFVFLRRRARLKRAEIPTLACLRILLPRI